jgi:flagellum-specific ATP synthase
VADKDHRRAAQLVRELLAVYREHEDLISIGAYRRGSNKKVDAAIDMQEDLNKFLRQQVDERSSVEDAKKELMQLFQVGTAKIGAPAAAKA